MGYQHLINYLLGDRYLLHLNRRRLRGAAAATIDAGGSKGLVLKNKKAYVGGTDLDPFCLR